MRIRHRHFVLAAAVLALAHPAGATVTVQASRTSLAENETLQLTVTTDTAGMPDLGELNQDFAILNRGVSTSRRSINGYATQRTTLNLTLMPRRSGELTIPAIHVGDQASQPLTVQVSKVAGGSAQPQAPEQGEPPTSGPYGPAQPFGMPPGMTDWMLTQGAAPWSGGTPDWSGAGYGFPEWTRPPPQAPSSDTEPVPVAKPAPPRHREPHRDYWPWLAGIAMAGWLATSLALLRRRSEERPIRRQAAPAPAVPPPRPVPSKAEIEAEVEQAYRRNDRFGARTALLHWGAAVWPDAPPSNLSRLAARCPPQLQRRILRLEEALYSPDEIGWNEHPVWEELHAYPAAQAAQPKVPGAATSS
jgi:hypothetical protein